MSTICATPVEKSAACTACNSGVLASPSTRGMSRRIQAAAGSRLFQRALDQPHRHVLEIAAPFLRERRRRRAGFGRGIACWRLSRRDRRATCRLARSRTPCSGRSRPRRPSAALEPSWPCGRRAACRSRARNARSPAGRHRSKVRRRTAKPEASASRSTSRAISAVVALPCSMSGDHGPPACSVARNRSPSG